MTKLIKYLRRSHGRPAKASHQDWDDFKTFFVWLFRYLIITSLRAVCHRGQERCQISLFQSWTVAVQCWDAEHSGEHSCRTCAGFQFWLTVTPQLPARPALSLNTTDWRAGRETSSIWRWEAVHTVVAYRWWWWFQSVHRYPYLLRRVAHLHFTPTP